MTRQPSKPKGKGRPSDYTPEKAKAICDMVASTAKSMRNICESSDVFPDEATAFRWMHEHDDFRKQYLKAKETQGILLSEEIMTGAFECREDTAAIAKVNLVFRVAQWHLSKLAPKGFGDKPVDDTVDVFTDTERAELKNMMSDFAAKHDKEY